MHTDIKDSDGRTAATYSVHLTLADYVEEFQPGPRGELSRYLVSYMVSIIQLVRVMSYMHSQYKCMLNRSWS